MSESIFKESDLCYHGKRLDEDCDKCMMTTYPSEYSTGTVIAAKVSKKAVEMMNELDKTVPLPDWNVCIHGVSMTKPCEKCVADLRIVSGGKSRC